MVHKSTAWGTAVLLAAMTIAGVAPERAAGAVASYIPLPSPVRVLDTRSGGGSFDGISAGLVPAGSTVEVRIAGRSLIPSGAAAAVLNVTAVDPRAGGYLTVFPCGERRPIASNLNFSPGQTIPNSVITGLGVGGTVCIYTDATTHLLADVAGFFADTTALSTLRSPVRLLDTRPAPTIDGNFSGLGAQAAGSVLALQVTGRPGIPAAATSVVLNVTATSPGTQGYITVFPCGQPQPNASHLNFAAGQTIANSVVSGLGTGGRVCLFTDSRTHLIVDASGYAIDATAVTPLNPARLLDTRPGGSTIDRQFAGGGARWTGGVLTLPIAGRGGVPGGAAVVILNLTAVNASASGYASVFPPNPQVPNVSNLNYSAGVTVPNMVVAQLGADGTTCILTHGATDLLVDVVGFLPMAGAPAPTGGCPTSTPPPPTATTFAAGRYLVNSQISPGRYLARPSGDCTWVRSASIAFDENETLGFGFGDPGSQVVVDILATDVAFEFDVGCGLLRRYTPPPAPVTSFSHGDWVVGADITPGTYRAAAAADCYWERNSGFDGTLEAILDNDFLDFPRVVLVTILPSDVGFLTSLECGRWTRV